MVDIDYRIELLEEYLNKVHKQVEECNPAPLKRQNLREKESGLLHNYSLASLHLKELRNDLSNKRPGILTSTSEKQHFKEQEKYYEEFRSRHEKLEEDFIKNCVCERVPR